MPKRKRHDVKVQVEMSVDVRVPFRNRQFLQRGRQYSVDVHVAGFLLEGRYAHPVVDVDQAV